MLSESSIDEFSTLPFVLSEELFIEFEQNIIVTRFSSYLQFRGLLSFCSATSSCLCCSFHKADTHTPALSLIEGPWRELLFLCKSDFKTFCLSGYACAQGNGADDKESIIKEFEHIHNKAIFDTFNEALNLYRPYYALGGPPYQWSTSEKNIVFYVAEENNMERIFKKARQKVIEW